jgi:hypothetical protein
LANFSGADRNIDLFSAIAIWPLGFEGVVDRISSL